MKLPIYQVDAFTGRRFAGNPAAVVPLESWLEDATMQSIALENNLSETAFFVREPDGRFGLRWFTPGVEVDLCGHATLASAHVILNMLEPGRDEVAFETRSGELRVSRDGDRLSMDFPARPPQPAEPHPRLIEGLGTQPQSVFAARDYMVLYANEEEVRTLQPNMETLKLVDRFAVIVTAPGRLGIDFVSRFFAPAQGVAEDPVTGSAHCTLIPYWARRLGRNRLRARQVSPRGGDLWCALEGDRVRIAGEAVLFLEGTITI
jgi:PhzF family phenazine biosynthesis protein